MISESGVTWEERVKAVENEMPVRASEVAKSVGGLNLVELCSGKPRMWQLEFRKAHVEGAIERV